MKLILCLLFSISSVWGSSFSAAFTQNEQNEGKKRTPKFHYGYKDRSHTKSEDLKNLGIVYLLTIAAYPTFQPEVLDSEKGSFEKYGDNFGKLVFDQDEPFWNWFVHPISGAQLYLYYRARGYSKVSAMTMSAISSTLFEFTVEVYSEPASVQDLYQTPVLGSFLGYALERSSMYLLNTGNPIGKFIGHVLNPYTLFWFYDGKITVYPEVTSKYGKLNLHVSF